MKHIAVCLILCLAASCLAAGWSVVLADEKKKDEPLSVSVTATSTEKPSPEKAKDAKDEKPAATEAAKPEANKGEEAKKSGDAKKPTAAPAKKPAAPPDKRPIHAMEEKPFRVTVELKGVFEAKRMAEVIFWPKQWSGFTILRAVEHGKQVKQGELLIAFDPEKIDQAIDDLRTQLKLADIDMLRLAEQLRSLEKLTPMDLAQVDRSQRMAEEDFEQLMKVDLPMSKDLAKFMLKSADEQLAYAKEELRQLEKMYKADDLTEETEEIILRRARFQVKEAEIYRKIAQRRHDEVMRFSLPRREESAKDSIERTRLSNKQAKVVLPLALKRSQLEIEKAKVERERLEKRLKELLADRALMTIKAPCDGVVYYGECVDGRWTGPTTPDRFARGASLPPNKVAMTIVSTRPIMVRTTTTEKDVRYLHEGLAGKVTPAAYPQARLGAVVSEVATVPDARNNFDTKLMVTNQEAAPVLPGMNCLVRLVVYDKEKALVIPPTALGTDPKDATKHFVHVVGKDGKSAKREVTVGERTMEAVEIVKGLSAGEKILKICPKDDEKPQQK